MIARRTFLAAAAALLAAPRMAVAGHATVRPRPRIGVLGAANPMPWMITTSAADIVCRWADDRPERLPGLAADLIQRGVDLVLAIGGPAARAARSVTSTVPIVFVTDGDPAVERLVGPGTGPGLNVTGLRVPSEVDVARRRLGLLAELAPGLESVAIVAAHGNSMTAPALHHLRRVAAGQGIRVHAFTVEGPDELERPLGAGPAPRAGAMLVLPDALFARHARELVDLAARNRLPALYSAPSLVEAGGLIALHGDTADLVRRATAMIARVLAGASPADVPVESCGLRLTVNVRTARTLGVALSRTLIAQADRVVGSSGQDA